MSGCARPQAGPGDNSSAGRAAASTPIAGWSVDVCRKRTCASPGNAPPSARQLWGSAAQSHRGNIRFGRWRIPTGWRSAADCGRRRDYHAMGVEAAVGPSRVSPTAGAAGTAHRAGVKPTARFHIAKWAAGTSGVRRRGDEPTPQLSRLHQPSAGRTGGLDPGQHGWRPTTAATPRSRMPFRDLPV